MAKSSPPSLEITVISAEDLRLKGRPVKKNTFVSVETAPNNSQATRIDSQGGNYPSWNQKLELPLLYNAKHVRLEVKCKTASGVRVIGSVNIPMSDFLDDYIPPNCLHFLSYRLKERDGDRNGVVNLSVWVKGVQFYLPPTQPSMTNQAAAGYKNLNDRRWLRASGNYQAAYNKTIAVGIPVPKGYTV